jgi:hypothetical protein
MEQPRTHAPWALRRLSRSVMLRPVLRCEECSCVSATAKGWLAIIAADPDDGEGPEVATYCPPCADRELRVHPAGYD